MYYFTIYPIIICKDILVRLVSILLSFAFLFLFIINVKYVDQLLICAAKEDLCKIRFKLDNLLKDDVPSTHDRFNYLHLHDQ